jgi:hypothetical protein
MTDLERKYYVTGTGITGPLRYSDLTLSDAVYKVSKMSDSGVSDARAFDDEGREIDLSDPRMVFYASRS